MSNILIVPPRKLENIDCIVDLAQEIQKQVTDPYISTLVTLETYDNYYKSKYIEGLIIRPQSFWDKLCLFELNQFDVVVIFDDKLVWFLACKRAKIRNIVFVSSKFSEKEKTKIMERILKLVG